jgi:oligopeptide/dipeptide ABC transporter ATP-binding protein
VALSGEIPSPANPPKGCRFHTRCPHVMPVCRDIEPVVTQAGTQHTVACHLHAGAAAPLALAALA